MNIVSRYQAPTFRALVIMIYYYHNLDLAVMITKIIQDVLETAKKKKKKNSVENRRSYREKKLTFHDRLTILRKIKDLINKISLLSSFY